MSETVSHLVLAESSAEFSPCRRYRYALRRVFAAGGTVMFIGLNPSTADESTNDPTVTRCLGFAKRWGYGTLVMANLYAWRATGPAALKTAVEPCGERVPGHPDRNLQRLVPLARQASLIVAAWGAWPGPVVNRPHSVLKCIGPCVALRLTKYGAPLHPLYAKGDLTPELYYGLGTAFVRHEKRP